MSDGTANPPVAAPDALDRTVRLDKEERQQAERLIDAVIDDPEVAAYEIVALRRLRAGDAPCALTEEERETVRWTREGVCEECLIYEGHDADCLDKRDDRRSRGGLGVGQLLAIIDRLCGPPATGEEA